MTHLGVNYFISDILERSQIITINGKELRTLEKNDRCLVLMCFIYKDQVYAHDYNPYNACALLLLLMKHDDYDGMVERIQKYNIIEPVKYCLQLCKYLHYKLFGKVFVCEWEKSIAFDFPVDGTDSIDQFRSHTTYTNDIIGHFKVPLENRYFMTAEELGPFVYKEMIHKYGLSPQELFDQRVVQVVNKVGLKHPPTQRLV